MTEFSSSGAGPLAIFLPLFWGLLALVFVLWVILPFAVFGIKRRLDRMIALLEETATPGREPAFGDGDVRLPPKPSERIFAALRRELLQARRGITDDGRIPGRAVFALEGRERRISLAELRTRGDIVEIEMDLGAVEDYAPALRPEAVLEALDRDLAGRPGMRILTGRAGKRIVVQVGPEGEARTGELIHLLKARILDLLPA